jgi:hypothetical protein
MLRGYLYQVAVICVLCSYALLHTQASISYKIVISSHLSAFMGSVLCHVSNLANTAMSGAIFCQHIVDTAYADTSKEIRTIATHV